MTTKEIIDEYTKLGLCVATERLLGEQMIQLTAQQRKAHLETLAQKDLIRNLEEDKNQCPASNTTTAQ
jgi:hypothetical protein